MILVVTAYVPIPGHPRSEEEYDRLGERLMAIDHPVMFAKGDLEHCWLWRWLAEWPNRFTWSISDNPKKNSLAYHCVQAEKIEFLAAAATAFGSTADVFVWLDYGLYHLPNITDAAVVSFLERADGERVIAIPGCHEKSTFNYNDEHPNWRFCGGVLIVPRQYVTYFAAAVRKEYIDGLVITGNIPWEVNVWSRVEHLHPELPIWQYRAGHDASMLNNYVSTLGAGWN